MDFSAKKDLIANIDDEVKILHPLLSHMLRNLEGVQSVVYTHGPNEKGADFVLSRIDQSIGTVGYVGVIAKTGKILANFTEIERQIDECRLPRLVQGMPGQVRLSEVWIVTTAHISRNAQEKISEKYSSQKVVFIDGESLTSLVDRHANYFWYDVPSEIGRYLQNLSMRLSALDSEHSVLSGIDAGDFYIEPDIQEYSRAGYVRKGKPRRPRMVNLLTEVLRHRVSVLEGEMGFGKSRAARHVANYFCAPDRYRQRGVLPIFFTFKEMLESGLSLRQLISETLGVHLSGKLIESATILVILDGIDEAIRHVNWKEFLDGLIAEAHSQNNVHVFFTTRPFRLLDEQLTIFQRTQRFLLRPLSFRKIIEFIERACASLSLPGRLFEDLQKSDLFRQLPQSPIAAALLSRLLAQNTNDLPSNLTELYAKSIENLLGRWDIVKGGCTEKEYKDAERVAMALAEFFVENSLSAMSLHEAMGLVQEWHAKRNTNVPLKALQERVLYKSGIFVCDEEQGLVCFRHRSFGEFLYAKERDRRNSPLPAVDSFSPDSIYVQFFYTGLRGDCEEHLRDLMAYPPKNELEMWLKILVMPDYLLAGYQTPYELTETNLYKLFIEAANLYLQIRAGKSSTRLVDLPEMHLLWFFQRVIRDAFEYEFFRSAIQSTIIRINDELVDSNVKYYALFFAACFAAQLDDASGFEFLLREYGVEKLPLQLSLALKLEGESRKDFSKLPRLREHEKKLNRVLQPPSGSSGTEMLAKRRMMDDLFAMPIRAHPKAEYVP